MASLGCLCFGFEKSGFVAMFYGHFGNWIEPVAGVSIQQYLSARDTALREILRRKGREAKRRGVEFRIVTSIEETDRAIDEYEGIYNRSWKNSEPYPNFVSNLIGKAAAHGALRLGICSLDGQPTAVQLWTVWGRKATVMKLAHDKAFNKLSLGSLLTEYMIRALFERDRIVEIDFGRGDNSYKRRWTSARKQRLGLIGANPRSIAGSVQIARQLLPRSLRLIRGRKRDSMVEFSF